MRLLLLLVFYCLPQCRAVQVFSLAIGETHREREKREREREDHLSHKSQQPGALFERRQVKNQKGIREEEF